MLSKSTRASVLELVERGVAKRRIARLLRISRNTVDAVIAARTSQPPEIHKPQKAEPYREQILELYSDCRGNLVRVHEELQIQGAELSYSALTAFCRRHSLVKRPKPPAGRYHFAPGQEMQHDTSPHTAEIGGRRRAVHSAAAVLCFSRMVFFQCYPRFRRFECKCFLTGALRFFTGAAEVVMVDNTHVIVLRGTGREMIPVPEMEAFALRFGFRFKAHERGDANRSAHVERSFGAIENNFLAGRRFADWDDLNRRARAWCERKNATYKRHLRARPVELYATERAHLRPLPEWVPDPYRIHHRITDVHGYVSVNTNRYSVPNDWISRQVQVCETAEKILITLGRNTVTHQRHIDPEQKWITLPEHQPSRRRKKAADPPRELEKLSRRVPELQSYICKLKRRGKKPFVLALRQVLRMVEEYPRQTLIDAVIDAEHFGLYDLQRLETMVLQRIDRDFFPIEKIGERDD